MNPIKRRLSWEQDFLASLRKGWSIAKAANAASISPGTAYGFRRLNARFAAEWEAAYEAGGRNTKRQLVWPNGAMATLYSAAEPESLRGPQHSHAWGDEMSGTRAG